MLHVSQIKFLPMSGKVLKLLSQVVKYSNIDTKPLLLRFVFVFSSKSWKVLKQLSLFPPFRHNQIKCHQEKLCFQIIHRSSQKESRINWQKLCLGIIERQLVCNMLSESMFALHGNYLSSTMTCSYQIIKSIEDFEYCYLSYSVRKFLVS